MPVRDNLPRIPDGVTLQTILEVLVEKHGWPALAAEIPVRCFQLNPSIASSLVFLRRTRWARVRVEDLYRRGLLSN